MHHDMRGGLDKSTELWVGLLILLYFYFLSAVFNKSEIQFTWRIFLLF